MNFRNGILLAFLLSQILWGCTKTTSHKEDTIPDSVDNTDITDWHSEDKGTSLNINVIDDNGIGRDLELKNESEILSPVYTVLPEITSKFDNLKISDTLKQKSPQPLIVKNRFTSSFIWPYSSYQLLFDNDIFNNTDRYYTNGVHLRYRSPALAFWKINSIFPAINKQSIEYNSIELNHEIYTPFTTKKPPTLVNDRPFASTLYLTFVRRTEKLSGEMSLESSLDVGVIGEIALGSTLQQGVHSSIPTNDFPLGWETQIKNDFLLNYNLRLNTRVFNLASVNSSIVSELDVGSRVTGISTGIIFVAESENSRKELNGNSPGSILNKNRLFNYSLETSIIANVVGYNATLNGGLFNKNNTFVLNFEQMEKLTLISYLKLTLCYKMVGISLTQFYSTPEFKNGEDHFWGQVSIQIGY